MQIKQHTPRILPNQPVYSGKSSNHSNILTQHKTKLDNIVRSPIKDSRQMINSKRQKTTWEVH